MARKKKEATVKAWKIVCYDGKRKRIGEPVDFLGYVDHAIQHGYALIDDESLIARVYVNAMDESETHVLEWEGE